MTLSTSSSDAQPADLADAGVAPGGRRHIPALDGLRGLAILMVLLFHFSPLSAETHSLISRIWLGAAGTGWAGVDLFFVLSGFLITGILLDARGNAHYFRNFYARRTLRIFPLYYATLAAIFLIAPLMSTVNDPDWQRIVHHQAWLWTYLWNFYIARTGQWMMPNANPALTPFNVGQFWSLAVEEHFYLIWPALVYLLPRKKLLLVACAAVASALALRTWGWYAGVSNIAIYIATPFRVDGLACGAILAILNRRDGGLAALAPRAGWIGMASGILVLAGAFQGWDNEHPLVYTIGFTLLAVFFSCLLVLVVSATPRSLLERLFSCRPMRFLGKYSYGLYVIHSVLLPVFWRNFSLVTLKKLTHSYTAAVALQMLLSSAISIALAWLSYNFFEKHFLSLKRFFPE